MAEMFQRKAEFLKICSNFLKVKRALAAELQQALQEDRQLAEATRAFEQASQIAAILTKNAKPSCELFAGF
jgi:hypothetical protein